MNQDMERFMNLKLHPERLSAEEAAWLLGFSVFEIRVLVSKGLLKPLGNPAPNGPKHFLTATLEDLKRDEKWHHKAAVAIQSYWRYKNERKQSSPAPAAYAGQRAMTD